MSWIMRDPFFDPIFDIDPLYVTDYFDRVFNRASRPTATNLLEPGQTQQTQAPEQQQGQMTTRGDNWRNRMLAGRGFKVDVSETPKNYIVRADLPGVDKKDVKIEISDDEEYMTIQAEKREEKKEDNESRHIVERSYGSFTRTFRLPDEVNVSECKTSFNNGVLELAFGKKEQQKKEPKRITIS